MRCKLLVIETTSKLNHLGRKIRVSEQMVSGGWNNSWDRREIGIWHDLWSPQIQADFLTYFYTIVFSKQNATDVSW